VAIPSWCHTCAVKTHRVMTVAISPTTFNYRLIIILAVLASIRYRPHASLKCVVEWRLARPPHPLPRLQQNICACKRRRSTLQHGFVRFQACRRSSAECRRLQSPLLEPARSRCTHTMQSHARQAWARTTRPHRAIWRRWSHGSSWCRGL
jgi:hypothetical protein